MKLSCVLGQQRPAHQARSTTTCCAALIGVACCRGWPLSRNHTLSPCTASIMSASAGRRRAPPSRSGTSFCSSSSPRRTAHPKTSAGASCGPTGHGVRGTSRAGWRPWALWELQSGAWRSSSIHRTPPTRLPSEQMDNGRRPGIPRCAGPWTLPAPPPAAHRGAERHGLLAAGALCRVVPPPRAVASRAHRGPSGGGAPWARGVCPRASRRGVSPHGPCCGAGHRLPLPAAAARPRGPRL